MLRDEYEPDMNINLILTIICKVSKQIEIWTCELHEKKIKEWVENNKCVVDSHFKNFHLANAKTTMQY